VACSTSYAKQAISKSGGPRKRSSSCPTLGLECGGYFRFQPAASDLDPPQYDVQFATWTSFRYPGRFEGDSGSLPFRGSPLPEGTIPLPGTGGGRVTLLDVGVYVPRPLRFRNGPHSPPSAPFLERRHNEIGIWSAARFWATMVTSATGEPHTFTEAILDIRECQSEISLYLKRRLPAGSLNSSRSKTAPRASRAVGSSCSSISSRTRSLDSLLTLASSKSPIPGFWEALPVKTPITCATLSRIVLH